MAELQRILIRADALEPPARNLGNFRSGITKALKCASIRDYEQMVVVRTVEEHKPKARWRRGYPRPTGGQRAR